MAVTIRSWADRELATIANKDDPIAHRLSCSVAMTSILLAVVEGLC